MEGFLPTYLTRVEEGDLYHQSIASRFNPTYVCVL